MAGKGPTVLVVGAGAVGGYYGARLAQAGATVSLVCRSDFETVQSRGLSIKSESGDFQFQPAHVLKAATDYPGHPDYVLVSLKVLPRINVQELIQSAVGPDTAVVLLQNGIGIEASLAAGFPKNEIISALAFVCLSRPEPGVVLHLCYGRVALGKYPGGPSAKAGQLQTLFSAAGVPCEVTDEIVKARWRKLVWNAPFNPISVLAGGVDTRQILDLPDTRDMVRKVMQEIWHIARAEGHELDADAIEQNIQATLKMTPYKTSMLQDYEAGRPLETEAILGNALRIAKDRGLAVPYLTSLFGLMKLLDRKSQPTA